VPIQNSGIEPM